MFPIFQQNLVLKVNGVVLTLCLSLGLAACGFGGAQADEPGEQFQIRKPSPTFTPTVQGANETGSNGQSQPEAANAPENTTSTQGESQTESNTTVADLTDAANNGSSQDEPENATAAADPGTSAESRLFGRTRRLLP